MAVQITNGNGRKLGLLAAIALVMGNMIGSGVFLLPASLAPFGWNAVAAWILTIGGVMILAFVLVRLGKALPHATGPTGFVTEAFGPVFGFLIGWVYWISIWTAVVTIAVAAISYLSSLIPAIASTAYLPGILAIGLLWIITLINMGGVRLAGNFQIVTLLIKVVPLVVVIVIAAALLAREPHVVAPFPEQGLNLTAVNASVALTLWALLGFESASLASARVENSEVNVPRATLWGTALTGLLYLSVCSAIALMLPEDVASSSPAPFANFVDRYWTSGAGAMIAIFAMISCIGALNGWVLMQGELPRSMAQQGILPGWLAKTDPAGTPHRALLLSSAIATVFVLMNSNKGLKHLFEYMLLLSTSATLWLYLACALAAVRLNVVRPFALAGMGYAVWTLWGAGIGASGMSFILMAAGLPIYILSRTRQKATN